MRNYLVAQFFSSDSQKTTAIYSTLHLLSLLLVENDEFAKKDRPEIRIDTDDLEALYQELIAKPKQLFHSNLATIKLQPWV